VGIYAFKMIGVWRRFENVDEVNCPRFLFVYIQIETSNSQLFTVSAIIPESATYRSVYYTVTIIGGRTFSLDELS